MHFIIDAVEQLDLRSARVNERGSGSEQYPPATMLALLVYSYATGTFGSRRIEQTTFDNVAVRFLCADTHPDHDTICAFRRQNRALLASAFAQILELAILGFAHTVGEFGVVLMIGGNIPDKTRVISMQIYNHVEALEYGQAHGLAAGLLVFSFVVLLGLYLIGGSRNTLGPAR